MPIIVIEGLDGSGKHTQAENLVKHYSKTYHTHLVDFPRYERPSSTLVREHLASHTSTDPVWENPYTVSSYYACDRAISYQTEEWRDWYQAGHLIILDRYMTSNMIYQAAKQPIKKRIDFWNWLCDYEFNKLQIPRPDYIAYLKLSPEATEKLIDERVKNKQSHDPNIADKKDAYEKDARYQRECYFTANQAATRFNWQIVNCDDKINGIRSIKEIAKDLIYNIDHSDILIKARKLSD